MSPGRLENHFFGLKDVDSQLRVRGQRSNPALPAIGGRQPIADLIPDCNDCPIDGLIPGNRQPRTTGNHKQGYAGFAPLDSEGHVTTS